MVRKIPCCVGLCVIKREHRLRCAVCCVCILLLLCVYWLRMALLPFCIGGVLAYLLTPLMAFFRRFLQNSTCCVLLSLFITICGMTLFVCFVTPVLLEQFRAIYQSISSSSQKIESRLLAEFFSVERMPEYVQNMIHNMVNEIPLLISTWASNIFENSVSYISHTAIDFILIISVAPFTAFYLMRDGKAIGAQLAALIPEQYKRLMLKIVYAIDYVFVNFMRGQLLISSTLTVYFIICFFVMGFHTAIGLGIIMGCLSLIPYAGVVAMVISCFLLCLLKFSLYTAVLIVAVVVGFSQTLDIFVLRPKLMGEKLGLHPVITVMSIIVSANLFGVVGMFLAIPLTVLLMMAIKPLVSRYKLLFVCAK